MRKNIVFYSVDFKPNKYSGFIDCKIHFKLKDANEHIKALIKDDIACRINRHGRMTDLCIDGDNKIIKEFGEF